MRPLEIVRICGGSRRATLSMARRPCALRAEVLVRAGSLRHAIKALKEERDKAQGF